MNTDHDRQLEIEIRRELKALPELTAPPSVANRVMATIESRLNVPWYRCSWEAWPLAFKTTSFAAMVVLFAGLCFAGWDLSRTEMVSQATLRVGQWSSGLDSAGNILGILVDSTVLVVKKLGTAFIVACVLAAGLGYATCLGLGTVYFRLAFSKRKPSHL